MPVRFSHTHKNFDDVSLPTTLFPWKDEMESLNELIPKLGHIILEARIGEGPRKSLLFSGSTFTKSTVVVDGGGSTSISATSMELSIPGFLEDCETHRRVGKPNFEDVMMHASFCLSSVSHHVFCFSFPHDVVNFEFGGSARTFGEA
jgi:hypothetical protein